MKNPQTGGKLNPNKIDITMNKIEKSNINKVSKAVTYPISLEKIEELIKDDNFILQLLRSEKLVLEYKKNIYRKRLLDPSKITGGGKKKDIFVPSPVNPKKIINVPVSKDKSDVESISLSAKKRRQKSRSRASLEIPHDFITYIYNTISIRLAMLDNLDDKKKIKKLINEKREAIEDLIHNKDTGIASIRGESRENTRRFLYGKIIIFAKAPHMYINSFINTIIMGGAGIGKTKLAYVLSEFYTKLGILTTNVVNVANRTSLVAGFIGHTGIQTQKKLIESLEGVLFIDEAYQLGCGSERDFGQEAITEIVNFLDKNIGLIAVIAAGYKNRMIKCFLGANEGMNRRFPSQMELSLYTSKDLYELFYMFVSKNLQHIKLRKKQKQYIYDIIYSINELKVTCREDSCKPVIYFDNQAGDMLNLASAVPDDFILSDDYDHNEIKNTFAKFFQNKGLYIKFD
jgi:hypothetical protein